MKKHFAIVLFLLFAVVFVSSSFGQAESRLEWYENTELMLLSTVENARIAALGNCDITASGPGNAMFYNPANMVHYSDGDYLHFQRWTSYDHRS